MSHGDKMKKRYAIGLRLSPSPLYYAASIREYHKLCWYCGVVLVCHLRGTKIPSARTVDHVVPQSVNPKSRKKVPACRECNQLKSDLSLAEFRIVFFGLHASIHRKFYGEKREEELRSLHRNNKGPQ